MCVTYKDCEVRLRIAAMMSLLRIPPILYAIAVPCHWPKLH
jgi:hypothetical protein